MKIALVGNPNCGKTALFNALTGGKQKVGNYPGVTVERKEGILQLPSGAKVTLLDLPGTYSLDARTPDEVITRNVVLGTQATETAPQLLIAVVDANHLDRNLGLILEVRELGIPFILAINMMDVARDRGLELDLKRLSHELGVPVVPTVAPRNEGIALLAREVEQIDQQRSISTESPKQKVISWVAPNPSLIRARFVEVDRLVKGVTLKSPRQRGWSDRADRIVLHPVWGSLLLLGVLIILFQAIFSWAQVPMEWIKTGINAVASGVGTVLPAGPLQSLIVDGVIAGVGSVLVFLPQIIILFG